MGFIIPFPVRFSGKGDSSAWWFSARSNHLAPFSPLSFKSGVGFAPFPSFLGFVTPEVAAKCRGHRTELPSPARGRAVSKSQASAVSHGDSSLSLKIFLPGQILRVNGIWMEFWVLSPEH